MIRIRKSVDRVSISIPKTVRTASDIQEISEALSVVNTAVATILEAIKPQHVGGEDLEEEEDANGNQ